MCNWMTFDFTKTNVGTSDLSIVMLCYDSRSEANVIKWGTAWRFKWNNLEFDPDPGSSFCLGFRIRKPERIFNPSRRLLNHSIPVFLLIASFPLTLKILNAPSMKLLQTPHRWKGLGSVQSIGVTEQSTPFTVIHLQLTQLFKIIKWSVRYVAIRWILQHSTQLGAFRFQTLIPLHLLDAISSLLPKKRREVKKTKTKKAWATAQTSTCFRLFRVWCAFNDSGTCKCTGSGTLFSFHRIHLLLPNS